MEKSYSVLTITFKEDDCFKIGEDVYFKIKRDATGRIRRLFFMAPKEVKISKIDQKDFEAVYYVNLNNGE